MIFRRHWIALVVAGACCAGTAASAQDNAAAAPSSSSGSADAGAGATSAFGSGASATSPFSSGTSSGTTSPFGSLFDTPAPAAPTGSFGTNPTGTAPPATGTPGASSAFGAGFGFAGGRTQESAPSFNIPGAYGQNAQSFTLGEGRLAKPRFEYSATVQMGYDDNVLQTPSAGIAAVTQEVLVDPGAPPETIFVPQYETRIVIINGVPTPTQVFVGNVPFTKPGRDPQVENQLVAPGQEPIGSFFTRTSLGAEITLSSRRTVFTMDLRGNSDFYFSRPKDKNDLTGSLAFSYLHSITPRLQFSATTSLAYLSQPDLRIVNGPTQNVGDYFNGTFRANLSYRWAKRFSTVTSLSLNSLLYSEKTQQAGNYYEGILGTEARYQWSRRLTLIGELRYGQTDYPDNQLLNSNTAYLLLGAEYILSKRISTSIRIGESFRSFTSGEVDSGVASAPYMEASFNWRLSRTGVLAWNSRLGFEEPGSTDTEVLGFRTGLSFIQAFSARMRGTAGVSYVNRKTSFNQSNTDYTEQSVDLSAGLQYTLTKHFSLSASYSYIQSFTSTGTSDYYRNRIFFGGEYTF